MAHRIAEAAGCHPATLFPSLGPVDVTKAGEQHEVPA